MIFQAWQNLQVPYFLNLQASPWVQGLSLGASLLATYSSVWQNLHLPNCRFLQLSANLQGSWAYYSLYCLIYSAFFWLWILSFLSYFFSASWMSLTSWSAVLLGHLNLKAWTEFSGFTLWKTPTIFLFLKSVSPKILSSPIFWLVKNLGFLETVFLAFSASVKFSSHFFTAFFNFSSFKIGRF